MNYLAKAMQAIGYAFLYYYPALANKGWEVLFWIPRKHGTRRIRTMQLQSQGDTKGRPSTTSEEVIPSVPGEFYVYSATFTPERPLGYLMKCKANKDRPMIFAEEHPEVDLVFLFGDTVHVCAPNARPAFERLVPFTGVNNISVTLIHVAGISDAYFDLIRKNKDIDALMRECPAAVPNNQGIIVLRQGGIYAVTTESEKYCLFRVAELTATSVRVDACHILLP